MPRATSWLEWIQILVSGLKTRCTPQLRNMACSGSQAEKIGAAMRVQHIKGSCGQTTEQSQLLRLLMILLKGLNRRAEWAGRKKLPMRMSAEGPHCAQDSSFQHVVSQVVLKWTRVLPCSWHNVRRMQHQALAGIGLPSRVCNQMPHSLTCLDESVAHIDDVSGCES